MSNLSEIIEELEESQRKLSRLHDKAVPRYGGSITYDGSTIYSPILENLNTVIQDLKSIRRQ